MTIKNALFLSIFIGNFCAGFTAPIIEPFFKAALVSKPAIISGTATLIAVIGLVMSIAMQNPKMVTYCTKNFTRIAVILDVLFFILAIIGPHFIITRYVLDAIVVVIGVSMVSIAQKNNIVSVYKKTQIIVMQQKLNSFKKAGMLFGAIFATVIFSFVQPSIEITMLVQWFLFMISHRLQIIVNKRISQDVLKKEYEDIKFIDIINDTINEIENMLERIIKKENKKSEEKDPLDI